MEKKRDRTEYMRLYHLKNREKFNEKSKKYYAMNTDACKQMVRDWQKDNPELVKAHKQSHYVRHRADILQITSEYKKNNRHVYRASHKRSIIKAKSEFVAAYGGRCACCGEDRLPFLTCDHINRDGKHDRALNIGGIKLYRKARNLGYPKDKYRVLCMNCNFAIRFGDVCPHQEEKEYGISVAC